MLGCGHISWSTVEEGAYGKYKNSQDAYLVVRDSVAWSFLYAWTTANAPAPTVDFSNDLVAAALLGTRPSSGYKISFTGVEWNGMSALAQLKETKPAPGSITLTVLTGPYAFARLTKVEGQVYFKKDAAAPVAGIDKTYPGLVKEEYLWRKQNGYSFPEAPSSHLSKLQAGKCPFDATTLKVATLPASGAYTDISNTAYFCPNHGRYWIKHVQGAFVGTITIWWGPLLPGGGE